MRPPLPATFFPEGRVALDAHGVPFVNGQAATPGVPSIAQGVKGISVVIRNHPGFLAHYFHFMEVFIGIFSYHMQYLGDGKVERIIFGAQPWRGSQKHNVQEELIRAIYGDIEIIDEHSPWYGTPTINLLEIDAFRVITTINKFLEPFEPEARRWMPEIRRRVLAEMSVPSREPPRRAIDIRCSYVSRVPPRTLSAPAKDGLLKLLRDRFATVAEIDFGEMPWREQVQHSSSLDLLVGVHGNGLTNLLWLPPHGITIEIFPKGAHHYDYQIMAEIAGTTYFGIEGDSPGISRETYAPGDCSSIYRDWNYAYRDWSRVGPPGGDLNQSIDQLPSSVLCQILDLITDRFDKGQYPSIPG